ncbi:MAG: xanthine dehydrogenase small subunit [Gammaproteobacteria bacterium]|nr:xanthine dehydrogenase small subunit [Gammaproteobacteria bacterium]
MTVDANSLTSETDSAPTSDAIRFILDGETFELERADPTRTVLEFLREDLGRTGTKEGCAEGDCGACTVVVGEVDHTGEDLDLRAVNACIQFLPTLDGKELFTVESLTANRDGLHPVQRAMVDCHGSQCGFCTPGFVMSLFALYKTNPSPTRMDIDDALAGNLCRCTGYRPIVAAARSMYANARNSDDWLTSPHGADLRPAERIRQHLSISRESALEIVHGERRFLAPIDAAELAHALARQPEATILAGGTDIGLWVTKQYRQLHRIVYTGRVRELRQLDISPTHIEIGAAVPLADAARVMVERYPGLEELFRRFASPPIRNIATMGGNIANGSPIGDSMPALMVAGTTLLLQSIRGIREVALDRFYAGYQQKDLQPGEFIRTIRIPLPDADAILRSHKLSKRFDQDISAVCTAYRLQLDGDRVREFRMACGGLAGTVKRAAHCERAVIGHRWDRTTVDQAAAALADDFSPITDMRGTADYRLRGAQNLLVRFFLETRGEVAQTVYGYGRRG